MARRCPRSLLARSPSAGRIALTHVLVAALSVGPGSAPSAVAAQTSPVRLERGVARPGTAIVVATDDQTPRTLCEPDCVLTVPRGAALRLGVRRDARIDWTHTFEAHEDLRLDVRLEDRSTLRGAGHVLLVLTGLLLAASAVVGIAAEPRAPDLGWFGPHHALVFAGIAGGIVLTFGVTGAGLAIGYERDAEVILPVPTD